MEEFCRKMSDVLDNPSFETKQRILRLVVDKILVSDEEVTIQHTVPISDVRLWCDHYPEHKPNSLKASPASKPKTFIVSWLMMSERRQEELRCGWFQQLVYRKRYNRYRVLTTH